jgi:aminoglycoside phosphotransferase (APT) family kinase protein
MTLAASKLHNNEIDIDVKLVQHLIQTQFPDWADLPIKLLQAGGTENVLYRLGEHLVIRLPRIPEAVAPLEKDTTWLTMLAPHLPLEIPKQLALGQPSSAFPFPWGVYQWLEGTDLFSRPLLNLNQLALDLTGFILALQQIKTPVSSPPSRGIPLHLEDTAVRESIALLPTEFQPKILEKIWQKALSAPLWNGTPVWSHGDLHGANLLGQNNKLSAVIDFGALGVGDPVYDYASAWQVLDAPSRGLFRDILELDDSTWLQACAKALRSAALAYPYYLQTNPVLTGIARYSIEQILLDFNVLENHV